MNISNSIRDGYVELGELDRCPQFWHLFAYAKGLEYILDKNGHIITKELERIVKESMEIKDD